MPPNRRSLCGWLVGLFGLSATLAQGPVLASAYPADSEPPPGVEQLLPRGAIPAVFEPVFVSAAEAEIPDDAWILGVFLNGESHAYSLNLLNRHEVVNDVLGGAPVAAVW